LPDCVAALDVCDLVILKSDEFLEKGIGLAAGLPDAQECCRDQENTGCQRTHRPARGTADPVEIAKYSQAHAALRISRSILPAPLLIVAAIMIREIPPTSTATPISVPIAQRELEGHLAKISAPITKLAIPSKRSHPHPSAGLA
jgi:hypothetical protein